MQVRFDQVKNSLYKEAWTASKICPALEFEDFVREGYYRLIKCCQNYKPYNGNCFNTYFAASIRKFFKGMIAKKAKENNNKPNIDFDSISSDQYRPDKTVTFLDYIFNLDKDCQAILEIALDNDYLTNRGKIREYMRDCWKGQNAESRINKSFGKIKKALRNY